LPINTFGVILVLAFLVGKWYIVKDAIRQGLDGEQIDQLCWLVLGAIVIGGRLMFIITEPQLYLDAPWKIFYIWEGGLVYYGGFLATVGTVMWFAWKHNLPIWKLTDLFTVGGMLGLGIGRWGCFFAGDDHGRVIPGTVDALGKALPAGDPAIPWYAVNFQSRVPYLQIDFSGVHYFTEQNLPPIPPDAPAAVLKDPSLLLARPAMEIPWMDQWLYPSQWMMSGKALLLFVLLMLVARNKKFDGQLTAILLMGYGVLRSIIETFRGDMDRGVYFESARKAETFFLGRTEDIGFYMTNAQFISVALFILGAWLYISKRHDGVAPVPKKVSSAPAEKQVSSTTEAKGKSA
jgi:prolipoprotein diacylglyceryl transferase